MKADQPIQYVMFIFVRVGSGTRDQLSVPQGVVAARGSRHIARVLHVSATCLGLSACMLPGLENGGATPTVRDYTRAIRACKQGCWQDAVALWAEIHSSRLQADRIAWGATIHACEKAAQWRWAVFLLFGLPGFGLDVIACNSAMSACAKARRWQWSLRVLSRMERDGLQPDVVSYTAIMSAYQRVLKWKQALRTFGDIQHKSMALSVVTLNSAITICGDARTWQNAHLPSSGHWEDVFTSHCRLNLRRNCILWEDTRLAAGPLPY